jgi:hypothetical protein
MAKNTAPAVKNKDPEDTGETTDTVETPAPPPAPPEQKEATLTVIARIDGFRRAGRVWRVTPITVAAREFSPQQLAALLAEPMLTVTRD